jgi:hypothetical protein
MGWVVIIVLALPHGEIVSWGDKIICLVGCMMFVGMRLIIYGTGKHP